MYCKAYAEPLVSEPRSDEVEISVENLKERMVWQDT